MRPTADTPTYMKVVRAHWASLDLCRLLGGELLKKTFMRPAADTPTYMKVVRAHWAFLNLCRLLGGGFLK